MAQTATFSVTSLASPAASATTTYNLAGGTTSIADVFVFGKYISLLDSRVIAGGRVASFEILSREVIHVQIPSNVIPTTTEDDKTYIEVYVATPNGTSNSLLIPYRAAPPPPPPAVAYDVASTTQTVDVYYQWLPGRGGKPEVVATADPGTKGIGITWNSDTGIAPRRIQAQFSATVNGQNVVLVLQAAADSKDDYTIDGRQFAVTLLKRLQEITAFPSGPSSPITFTVKVQPWIPTDPEGLRVKTDPKELKSKVTVNLHYNATGVNALPDVEPVLPTIPSANRSPGQAPGDGTRLASASGGQDPALVRTAQASPSLSPSSLPTPRSLPTPSSFLNAPQPPPALNTPALLGPNVSSEAEQIAKMLTGQPIATTVASPLSQAPAAGSAAAAVAIPAPPPPPAAAAPPIVINPSPVVLIPSSPAPQQRKHESRIHKMFNRLGNRVGASAPAR
jgi:hypothetical protein